MKTKGDTTSYPVDRQKQTIQQEQGSQSGETVRWPATIQTTEKTVVIDGSNIGSFSR